MNESKEIKIAIAGYGNVGKGTLKTIITNNKSIERRSGFKLIVKTVFSRNIKEKHDEYLDTVENKTEDLNDILNDNEIDIIVEVLGGMTTAKELILKSTKPIVTANKALLANSLEELIKDRKADIEFEASVAGAIPIIRAMKESLTADNIESISGILNGTCNYILTNMTKQKIDFNVVLKEAQDKGYAEADPTFDIDGIDTAHKICILASMAFCNIINMKDIYIRGIRNILLDDIIFAMGLGYTVKLVADASIDKDNNLYVYVIPSFIKDRNFLARTSYSFNAIKITSDIAGDNVFYGVGAGGINTSSAIVSDIISIAKNKAISNELFSPILGFTNYNNDLVIKDFRDKEEDFYVRFKSLKNKIDSFVNAFNNSSINVDKTLNKDNNMMFILRKTTINNILNSIKIVEDIENIFIAKIKH
ncbi:homoserine dehydrogenase [Brachyspira pilosicoli]|uniref:homoserine dehydrogenase n=1 Tax=Brachyspira pilosicoli TaxID=52584 RepID=UPI0012F4B20F|nr:homoserine dehydrogenase [Brachyspira pilosicoli]